MILPLLFSWVEGAGVDHVIVLGCPPRQRITIITTLRYIHAFTHRVYAACLGTAALTAGAWQPEPSKPPSHASNGHHHRRRQGSANATYGVAMGRMQGAAAALAATLVIAHAAAAAEDSAAAGGEKRIDQFGQVIPSLGFALSFAAGNVA